MRISELFEQITAPIAAQGPGGQPGSPALGTSPTAQAQTTATTTSSIATTKASVDILKQLTSANFDSNKFTTALTTAGDGNPGTTTPPDIKAGTSGFMDLLSKILGNPETSNKFIQAAQAATAATTTRKP
jgi:hypothetical protein